MRVAAPLFIVACVLLAAGPAGAASWLDDAMLSVEVENDFFTPHGSDRHYTNGFRLEALSPRIGGAEVPDWSKAPYRQWPTFDLSGERRIGVALGQNVYTPADTDRPVPDPNDRPYAGWAYVSVLLATETSERLDTVELELGMVGPAAGARYVQNGFHHLINVDRSSGWDYQLHNEPGLVASVERRWRVDLGQIGAIETDAIPIAGASVGNVMTYGSGGVMLRLGQGLHADFGPPRIRPALPGSPGFAGAGAFGWYLFAGVDGRIVGHDIFLDGNTFRDSPSVDKKTLVADVEAGLVVMIGEARLTYSFVLRTPEFHGQEGADRFGAFSFTWRF